MSKIHLVSSYSRELIDSRVDEKAFEAGHPKSHHGLGDVRCIFPLTTDIHSGFLLCPVLPLYNTEKALGKPYKSHLKKIMLLKHILFDWLNIFLDTFRARPENQLLHARYLEMVSVARDDSAPEAHVHPALTSGCSHLCVFILNLRSPSLRSGPSNPSECVYFHLCGKVLR